MLVSSVRAGALTRPQGAKAFAAAASLLARGEMEPSASAVYAAALRFGISAYDAHFAALALNLGASLVTADKALLSRCSGFAVPMESF